MGQAAESESLVVVLDNHYLEFSFDGISIPTMRSLEHRYQACVIKSLDCDYQQPIQYYNN